MKSAIKKVKIYLTFAVFAAILIADGFYIGQQNLQQIIPWSVAGVLFILWRVALKSKQPKEKSGKVRRYR